MVLTASGYLDAARQVGGYGGVGAVTGMENSLVVGVKSSDDDAGGAGAANDLSNGLWNLGLVP